MSKETSSKGGGGWGQTFGTWHKQDHHKEGKKNRVNLVKWSIISSFFTIVFTLVRLGNRLHLSRVYKWIWRDGKLIFPTAILRPRLNFISKHGCVSILDYETRRIVSVMMSTEKEGPWEDTKSINSRQKGTSSSCLAEELIAGWSGSHFTNRLFHVLWKASEDPARAAL